PADPGVPPPARTPWAAPGKAPCPPGFAIPPPARSYQAGREVAFALVARGGEAERIQISADRSYLSMNFDGQVPAPTLRVTQGDRVHVTLTNEGVMAHSLDLHAARTAWSAHYPSIAPGETTTLDWTAEHVGVFMYHCGTEPVIMHVGDGMYGAVIVDPGTPRPPAREYVVVQSEFYGAGHDVAAMLNAPPDVVAFNGRAFQYRDAPLAARVGERVRFFVVDAGPSAASAFHVVGGLFDHVELDGNPANALGMRQTVEIAPGGGALCELVFDEPGRYPFVSHRFADATRGAVGMIDVT
ncbi:MAG: multicopper oxidase domain-containing protein, partial [Myxococcales bacterium]|nr:multicopper oxidase domain-containing protein [Myxococcales bacterium]